MPQTLFLGLFFDIPLILSIKTRFYPTIFLIANIMGIHTNKEAWISESNDKRQLLASKRNY